MIGDRYKEGVLVDTCIWIEFFRKNTAATQALTDLIEARAGLEKPDSDLSGVAALK